jgi:putative transposase
VAAPLKLFPGNTIRWQDRSYLIVDCEGLAVIARQPGKRRTERIRISEIQRDHAPHAVSRPTPDLVAVPEEAWRVAVKRFKILKPLLNKDSTARTLANVKKVARVLGKHPATVYRWIENYKHSERLSVFLRKERSDRGASRLSSEIDKIIDTAINKIYLKAEKPNVAAVIEEVFRFSVKWRVSVFR